MSGPRPEARQVRTQLSCRGSAVRSIALFGQFLQRSIVIPYSDYHPVTNQRHCSLSIHTEEH
jgi:hypothetical protein